MKKRYKEVAFFCLGGTPQIITEGLYALIHQKPPTLPDEIVIITTQKGEELFTNQLMASGLWQRFFQEHLHHSSDPPQPTLFATPFWDTDTPPRNLEIGEMLYAQARRLCADESHRVHAFLAGGRKTMSFYMGLSMSLVGRPWDRLYHILISPREYENNPDFFYPTKENNGKINLMEVPFFRLRSYLFNPVDSLTQAVKVTQKNLDEGIPPYPFHLSLRDRCLYIGNLVLPLQPLPFLLYYLLVSAKVHHCTRPEKPTCAGCTECYLTMYTLYHRAKEEYLPLYKKMFPGRTFLHEDMEKRMKNLTVDHLRQHLSRLKRSLRDHLPEKLYPLFTIQTLRRYADTRYGILIDKTQIQWEENHG